MSNGTRILIVEDEFVMGRALAFLFRKEGFQPDVVGDGGKALDLLLLDPPDVVILDLDLPTMSGFEICERLRDDAGTRHVRIIALTASPHEEDRARMMALGADEFMTKPFDPALLVERVKELVSRAEGDRS